MEKRRVVLTGIGVLSPVGCGVEKFWSALVAGKSGVGPITRFDASQFDARIAAELKDYKSEDHFNSKDARKTSLFIQYAVVAAREAVINAGFKMDQADPHRVGVVIGSGIGCVRSAEEEYQKFLDKGPGRISPFFIPKMIINEIGRAHA